MESEWKWYRKKMLAAMRPYIPGESMAGIAMNAVDVQVGHPKEGDYIARNQANHEDMWLVSGKFVEENYEPVE